MKHLLIFAVLLLTACTQPTAVLHEGPVLHTYQRAARDQCFYQPKLDWCVKAKKQDGAPK